MTLEHAIKHYEKEAEKYMEYGIETECYQCSKEHEQLAEWLKQLVRAKSMMLDTSHTLDVMCDKVRREIGCKKCVYYEDTNICRVREWIKRLRIFSKSIKG